MTRELQNIDWGAIAKGELIPPGKYPARIDKVEDKINEKTGKESWNFTLTITEEPLIGRKIFTNFGLQPTALWKLRQLMKALGMATSGVSNIVADDFYNQEVGIEVVHETYEGELRHSIKNFYSLTR